MVDGFGKTEHLFVIVCYSCCHDWNPCSTSTQSSNSRRPLKGWCINEDELSRSSFIHVVDELTEPGKKSRMNVVVVV